MEKLELLAPSGDWDSFVTAINNGADAVYLGLGDYNARAKSTYFNKQNIGDTVRFAHIRGVKVYVTINTLVDDTEMSGFIDLVEACVNAKVDAYIVQDYGCASLLKRLYPKIVLHASTQMGIHNAAGAQVAKKIGFSRVVLSREVKFEDILAIKATGLEIEYFVQGALCVAFSGNCYFSALQHGMSGNRGKCLQLCRLPYTAYIDNEAVGSGYLLSARDLCLLPKLADLIDAGVISFKIEGRLRRAGYVGQAVATYRKAIDSILAHRSMDQNAEIKKLRQVFSRGDFNYSAYLNKNVPDNVINPVNQNHLGLKIGSIKSVERFKDLYKVGISCQHNLKPNDGLKFLDSEDREVDSLGVGNVEKQGNIYYIFTKHRLTPGLTVYLTLDSTLEEQVIKQAKLVPINIQFMAYPNQPFSVTTSLKDKPTVCATYSSDYICQMAKNAPTSEAEIMEIFNNLDLATFSASTEADIGNVFIPKSALKEARRALAPQLVEAIINDYNASLPEVDRVDCEINTNVKLCNNFDNIYVINENSDINLHNITDKDLVIFSPTMYKKEHILRWYGEFANRFSHVGLALPTVANEADCAILDDIIASLPKGIPLLINNAYGLKYASENYLIAGTEMNVYNSYSVASLLSLGVKEFVWSVETECKINNIYQFAYGRHTLMHFAHCPYKTIFGNNCQNCTYQPGLMLQAQDNKTYRVLRHQISQCYFTLFAQDLTEKTHITKKYYDLRSE